MRYLLNLVYLTLLLICSPWIAWTSIWTGKHRNGFKEKLLGLVPRRDSERPGVWLHAVSVGEVNLLRPLLDEIAREKPDWECVISTTTRTGMELARSRHPNHTVFYCPMDFSWSVAAALRRVRPELVVLTELELWPNLIAAARRSGARIAVVNGRLSERSARGYSRVKWLVRSSLRSLDLLAVQNQEYAERFRALGAPAHAVHVTGSIKFDGAATDRHNPKTTQLAALAGIRPSDVVFLAGSTQEPEEALALQTFYRLANTHPRLRLILVPRHPERFEEVARLLDQSGIAWQRRSCLGPGPHRSAQDKSVLRDAGNRDPARHGPETDEAGPRVLLVDAVGELGAWWGTARIGFVGGSMGTRGGQNMIEPAAYGVAISFGPKTQNFREVVSQLLAREAAVVVEDGEELTRFVERCLTDATFAQRLGHRAQTLVRSSGGATRQTVQLLGLLVDEDPQIIRLRKSA